MSIALSESAHFSAGTVGHTLHFEVDGDGIAVIHMDLRGRPMNVTTPELTSDLMLAFHRVATDASIKGAILTSGKPGCFVAGGDIKDFVNAYDRGMTRAQAFELSRKSSDFFRSIETCGKPVAAAINGLALGGGLELCLCCHYRVIADDSRAIVGQPEVTIGLLPGGGGTQRLPRLIGIEKALPLLLNGRHVKPQEALELGLVHEMVPAEDLIATAKHWLLAHPHAQQPWDVNGYALPGGTGALDLHAIQSLMMDTALAAGRDGHNYPAPPAILACVLEGTQVPIETGLRIESNYFSTLLTGVVARNLMRTTFVNKGLADKLAQRPSGVPKATIKRLGILGNGAAEGQLVNIAAAAGIEAVLLEVLPTGGCDLMVKILRPVDLPVARHAFRKQGADFIGIHLSASVPGRVLEIVVDPGADERAVGHAFDLARQLRHTPIALHGGKALYTHRLRTAYVNEGMCLLAEGVAPGLIENAAAAAGMAQGPLACADDIFGRGVGADFHEQPEKSTKVLWHGRRDVLRDVFAPKENQPDVEQIKTRLLHIQALETARCIEEGMIRHAADADVAAVFGCGFPAYTGGTTSLIDTIGIARFVSECEALAARHGARFKPSPWLLVRAGRGEPFHGRHDAAAS